MDGDREERLAAWRAAQAQTDTHLSDCERCGEATDAAQCCEEGQALVDAEAEAWVDSLPEVPK